MLKRAIVLMMALLMVAVMFLGCAPAEGEPAAADDAAADDAAADDAAADKDLTFGYIWYDSEDEWNQYDFYCFEDAANKKGVKVVDIDPKADGAAALDAVQDLITQEVDGISVFTITPELDVQIAKLANEAGIPITFENSLPAEGDIDYISCVACNYDDIGYAVGEFISKEWPGSKVFYAMGAFGMGIVELYVEGYEQAIEDNGNAFETVGESETDWMSGMGMTVTQDFIQSGTEFDVVFANSEQIAVGVLNALKEAGMENDVKIITTGGGPNGVEMLKNGEVQATATAPVSIQGYMTFKNLWTYVNGNPNPNKFDPLPIIVVTSDNIEDVISWEPSQAAIDYIGGLDEW